MLANKIRRLFITLCFIAQVFLLTGCWDRVEFNSLAIVTAIGIDLAENDQIELSVQIYIPQTSGGGGGNSESAGGTKNQSLVVYSKAKTLNEALDKQRNYISRKLFIGHNEIIIFGKKMAEKSLLEPLEYLFRQPSARERAHVFISNNTAKELLEWTPIFERSGAEHLKNLTLTEKGLQIDLLHLIDSLEDEAKSATLPWIQFQDIDNQKSDTPIINGYGVIKSGKMVGQLEQIDAQGVMWFNDNINKASITTKDKLVSAQLIRGSSNLKPYYDNGQWRITLQVDSQWSVYENNSTLDLSSPSDLKHFEALIESELKGQLISTLTKLQKDLHTDTLGFANAFHRKYPKEWASAKKEWEDIFPKVEVQMELKTSIVQTGASSGDSIEKSMK